MPDTRTLREKLEAMARQDVSPNEADIARAKLAAMGQDPPPPHRPTAVGAAGGSSWWWGSTSTGSVTITNWTITLD